MNLEPHTQAFSAVKKVSGEEFGQTAAKSEKETELEAKKKEMAREVEIFWVYFYILCRYVLEIAYIRIHKCTNCLLFSHGLTRCFPVEF